VRPSSLAVIGLGAIGGSLAWQSRLAGIRRVVGYSPHPGEGVQALKASAITELAETSLRAIRGAELVVLAVPPRATLELITQLGPALETGTVLTDVCSVKGPIVRHALAEGFGDRFAGGHPLAGTHETGFASARPDRLRGCVVYICETGSAESHTAAQSVSSFWRYTLEASPVRIDPDVHDSQLAWTSHLPQAVAYALARTIADRGLGGVSYGTGAKDTTRLAASSPELWLDILLFNRMAVGEALQQAGRNLEELRELIVNSDLPSLRRYLETAQAFRLGMER
jgi:prephenate dehydrogenase